MIRSLKNLFLDRLQGPPCETVAAAAGAGQAFVQFLPAFAYPPYLSGGHAGHQGIVLDIVRHHGTGGNHRRTADRMAAHDGAIGPKGSALAYERARVRAMHREMSPRSTHIREYARRTTENIVFDFNAFVDGDVVLDPDTVPDPDMVRHVNILPQRTVPADDGSSLNMTKMPDLRSLADAHAIVDIRTFMNEKVRHPSFFQT